MAIAFARVSIHTRSKGHSAVAASAYRSGLRLEDERTGEIHDYRNKGAADFSEVMLPSSASKRFLDRKTLWNEVERSETRKNSQLCKDVVLALPKELNLSEQEEISKQFAYYHFVQHGLACEIAIHDSKSDNPHAHILVTTRRLEGERFAKHKARDLNPEFAKGKVMGNDYWGEKWRGFQEDFFLEKGLDLNVDINHLIPEEHQGVIKREEHYIRGTNELIREERCHIALSDTDNLVNLISFKASVFDKRSLEKLISKTLLNDASSCSDVVKKVLSHKDVILLGRDNDGRLKYTTRNHYVQECRLLDDVSALSKRYQHQVEVVHGQTVATLRNEQKLALEHITNGSDISVLIGKPGTGKTYLMKILREVYEHNGFKLIGASTASKAAKGLEQESGITSHTIASLNYKLSKNYLQLQKNDVLVVDEAGMVDFSSLSPLIAEAKKANAKIILVGDPEQLKPIGKGDIFRGIAARTGYFSMEDIQRQRDLGDRQASLLLSKGEVNDALSHYKEKGALFFDRTQEETINKVIDLWQEDIKRHGIQSSALLSFTCKSVSELNKLAKERLQQLGIVKKESFDFQAETNKQTTFNEFEKRLETSLGYKERANKGAGNIELSIGDRVLFKKKSRELGVTNGDIGTIDTITKDKATVRLDSGEEVCIINGKYKQIDHAYALTVHKSQGMTVNNAHVFIDTSYWDKYLSYVSMTRHREKLHIYASKEAHQSLDELAKTLSRKPTKDNVIDWPLDYAIRYGFIPDSVVGKAINHIVGVGKKVRDRWNFIASYEGFLRGKISKVSISKQKELKARAKRHAFSQKKAHESAISPNLPLQNHKRGRSRAQKFRDFSY